MDVDRLGRGGLIVQTGAWGQTSREVQGGGQAVTCGSLTAQRWPLIRYHCGAMNSTKQARRGHLPKTCSRKPVMLHPSLLTHIHLSPAFMATLLELDCR